MPRVYLKYELPQEQEEYSLAYNGAKYKYAIDELEDWMRSQIKYDQTISPTEIKVLQLVRLKLQEIMKEEDI